MNDSDLRTEQANDIPPPLHPASDYSDWRVCLRRDSRELTKDFAKQFRVSLEESTLALLATASHSLGESIQVALPHGNISPPFSWLAITPEREPIWTGVLLRYLRTGIEEQLEYHLRTQIVREKQNDETDRMADEAINPEKCLERLSQAAGLQVLQCIAHTISRDNPKPPCNTSPIDRAVSLITPPTGLLRSLSKLSPLELLELEESLSGTRSISSRGTTAAPGPHPTFVWQLPEADAPSLFRHHGEWILKVPCVLTRGKSTSFPCVESGVSVLRQFDRLSQLLFNERHARHGNPRICRLDAETGKPIMRFLDEAGKWQADTLSPEDTRWVADLGIKLSLSLMRLEEEQDLDARLVENGLELAKFFARSKIRHLSVTGWGNYAENAETADLTIEERRAYLKICESNGIAKAELRRSSHGMTATERDRIVAKLLSLELIRQDGKFLRQNAA